MAPFVPHPLPIPKGSSFPVSNIPFGIFSTSNSPQPRPGVAIGDHVLDLRALAVQGHIQVSERMKQSLCQPTLNDFAALSPHERASVRRNIQELITTRKSPIYDPNEQSWYLFPSSEVVSHLPMAIGGFTDFSCSLVHMSNAGRIAGYPQLPANFFNVPPAYNGRASSIVVSGSPIHRPYGIRPESSNPKSDVTFAPSQKLDYEVELGMFVSNVVPYGQRVPASKAKDHIFGFVLLNDWTARDVQFYEMMPLGPFNGKAFATSISPWVVTLEALQEAGAIVPVEKAGLEGGKASSIPFFHAEEDVSVEALTFLTRNEHKQMAISKADLKHMHWSPFQMLAHQSSSGCGLSPGDLLGTGTLSSPGPEDDNQCSGGQPGTLGCLFELTEGGQGPIRLGPNRVNVSWLEDGDEVIIEGWAGEGDSRIGFGIVQGKIAPAID